MTVLIAVLAFIGGVTAVAVKGWIDYALEERRERKVLRAVARLISSELGGTKAFLQTVLVTDDRVGWWPKETSPFATPAWNEHRYLLAAGTNSVDWRLMRQAYASMPGLEAQYERATRGGKLGAPLHEDERAIVELDIDIIDTAIKTLADLENARLPFEGFRRTRYAIRHPVRATRLWRKNRAWRRRQETEGRGASRTP
jgi:hypothetical protein